MTAEPILYPQTYRTVIRCGACWCARPVSQTVDPRTGDLEALCDGCADALNDGRPIPLPTPEERAESWEWLARQHQNNRDDEPTGITEEHIASALETLAPHLSPEDGSYAFTLLTEMLLRLQDLRDAMGDPAAYEGGLTHAEHETDRDRMHALKTLTGGR